MHYLFSFFRASPDFKVWHSHPNQRSRILITAGVDGDEYAGIEAADILMKTYKGTTPITIIPLVNLAGFQAGTSWNPLDHRYPKHIFPGSPIGSSSARLMHKVSQYTKGIELWIDLHGGAKDEHLNPFIWASKVAPVLTHLSGRVLVESSIKKNVPYIILESGELGQTDSRSITRHLDWVHTIIKNLGKPAKRNWQPTYTKVEYQKNSGQPITQNTLWNSKDIIVKAS